MAPSAIGSRSDSLWFRFVSIAHAVLARAIAATPTHSVRISPAR